MPGSTLEAAFHQHRRMLWGVCYRLTGDGAESEDLVQETFRRAVETPPVDTSRPLGPWLVQVATRLGIDALRRRKTRGYRGPWLPAPVEDIALDAFEPSAERRYDERESATFAFLLALEVLTAEQRAVLVLRDALDFSVREVAEATGLTEANVRVTHHRARKAMEPYDAERCIVDDAAIARHAVALERLGTLIASGDIQGVSALLCDDAVSLNDGNGEFLAARSPIVGPKKIAMFYVKVQKLRVDDMRASYRVGMVNGLPALIATYPGATGGLAPRGVFRLDLDSSGLIRRIHVTAASAKLASIRWDVDAQGTE
jgi:RNA polymerase sigma-70 factor (ECF subfamily)